MLRLALLTAVSLLSACTASRQADSDVPATVTNPSPRTDDEIRGVIGAALHGAAVTIAADALTHTSFIAVERAVAHDPHGLPVNGRDPGKPEIFELRKHAGRCELLRRRTGSRVILQTAQCAAAALPAD